MATHNFRITPFYRIVAALLIFLEALVGWPAVVLAALPESSEEPPDFSNEERVGTRAYPAHVKAKKGTDQGVTKIKFTMGETPGDVEIRMSNLFPEPLIPVGDKVSKRENAALGKALKAYKSRTQLDDISSITGFLAEYPQSRWRAALQTNLGIVRRKAGYFTEALERLEDAWALGKNAQKAEEYQQANTAAAELADLNARFGRFDRMKEIFDETDARDMSGASGAMMNGAKEGYWMMTKRSALAFRCGPFAVNAVLCAGGELVPNKVIAKLGSTQLGTNLSQLEEVAGKVGLPSVAAKKGDGGEWQVPMVVHWKVGHFAAITRKEKGRYLIKDPTFGGEIWVTQGALDAEGTGYGLVSNAGGSLPQGWSRISSEEAGEVWGKGGATTKGDNPDCSETGCGGSGMAFHSILKMRGTLSLVDRPVGYTPPVGPSVVTMMRYKHLETGGPNTREFMNFGPYWECNWVGFVSVDSGGTVTLEARGGGTEVYNFSDYNVVTGQFKRGLATGAILKKKGETRYERELPDGRKEIYAQPGQNGALFLKEEIDPHGNKLIFNYDGSGRLTSIVDAIGQSTTISYKSNSAGVGFFKVHRITDPFGRYAEFSYDVGQTRLEKITDVIGIESSFTYGEDGFISRLTTPYGNTDFYQYVPAEDGTARGLLVILPDGSRECLESYTGHDKMTYYWDRKAMAMAPGDRTKAEQTRWLMSYEGNVMMDVPEWTKNALEARVDYKYPSQPASIPSPDEEDDEEDPSTWHSFVGDLKLPTEVIRKLDNNDDQIFQYEYNALGRVTKSVDPIGRTFSFMYAANNLDLMEVRQTKSGANDLLAKFTYNKQHLPLTVQAASGRTTAYVYNSRGQATSVTNPKNETTTLTYDGNGYLTQVNGPLSGSNDVADLAYDSYGRVETITVAEGPSSEYALTYSYDALDRRTEIEFPDGSTETTVYSRLDKLRSKDRLGRWTQYVHDALGQLAEIRDPLGRVTKYEWCRCGALQGLTDPLGQITKWAYDVQGRLIKKTYADSSHQDYEYESNLSRLASMTDPAGNVTDYTYNADDTLSTAAYTAVSGFADIPDAEFSWDQNYKRLTQVEANGQGYNYSYGSYVSDFYGSPDNARGLQTTIASSVFASSDMTFEYDELGRIVTRQNTGSDNVSTWAYDVAGRVSEWSNALGTFTPTYVNATYGVERLSSVEYPNGQTVNYDWETASGDFRLKEIENLADGGGALSKFNYVTDAMSRITQWKQQEGSETAQRYDLGYDAVDQVVSAVLKTDSTNAIVKQYYYGYDGAGNRTNEQVDGMVTSSAYNNLNQLTGSSSGGKTRFRGKTNEPSTVTVDGQNAWMTSGTNFEADVNLASGTNSIAVQAKDANNNVRTHTYQVIVPGGGSKTVTYDANGNMLNDGEKTYNWDVANRLIKITYADSSRSEFSYDVLGRRIQIVEKDDGGSTISEKNYVWDGLEITEERDENNDVVKKYSPEGMQFNGENYFYTRDHLGSVRELTNEESVVESAYSYDPYGKQETSLPSGMKLWLKADAGVTKDGSNKVSAWADQSGNSNSALQATSSKQPAWVDNAANGHPVMRFSGTDDILVGSVNFNVTSSDHTMIAVHKRTTATVGSSPLSFAVSLSPVDYGAPTMSWINNTDSFGTTNTFYGWGDAKSVDLSAEPTALHLSMISRKGGTNGNGGALTIRSVASGDLKETKATQTWTSVSTTNQYLVGCHNLDSAYPNQYLIGDVAEIVVYDRALSPSERTRVDYYFGRKYDRNIVQSDFRYTGHYFHEKSGLTLAPFRAYDSSHARWISRDPLKDAEMLPEGPNLYGYVANSPINYTDPTGKFVFVIPVAYVVVAAAGAAAVGAYAVLSTPEGRRGAQNLISDGLRNLGDMLNQAKKGEEQNSKPGAKPKGCPPGTRPIDESGLGRQEIHDIKDGVGAGAQDWTGIDPQGNVITGDHNGNAHDNGHFTDYTR